MGRNAIGKTQSADKSLPGTTAPGKIISEPTYSFSYDGSFSIFSYACASQFYDAFFFYHKAYFVNVFIKNLFFQSGNSRFYFLFYIRSVDQRQNFSIPLDRLFFISRLFSYFCNAENSLDIIGLQ